MMLKQNVKNELRQIQAIARVTFSELLRERILWSTSVFAVFLLAMAFALAQLSFHEPWRIALDFGSAGIGLVGSLMAIVVGGSLIAKEVKDRTLYLVLTKSIWRWQFVLGKIFGLFAVITLNTFLMYAVLMAVFLIAGGSLSVGFFENIILQLLEFYMLTSIAALFSAFSTATLSSIFAFSFWIIGHAMDDIVISISKIEIPFLRQGILIGMKVLPDFTAFDVKQQISHGIPISGVQVSLSILYGLLFCAFVQLAACLVFSKRDL